MVAILGGTDSGRTYRLTRKAAVRFVGHVGGFLLAGALVIALLIWAQRIMGDSGIKIPVIVPEVVSFAHQPANPGGTVTDYKGYSVNNLIIGMDEPQIDLKVVLAPPSPRVSEEDLSIRDAVVAGLINGKKIQIQAASDTARLGHAQTNRSGEGQAPGRQVDVISIPAGANVAQIAAFRKRISAITEWNRLSQAHPTVLRHRDWYIERTENGGNALYRLRVTGFDGEEQAEHFCRSMAALYLNCLPVETGK